MKKNLPDSVESPLPPEIQAIADKLPPGHPYPRNLMMLMQACAEVQRENGLTPEGLEADYRKMDAEKRAAEPQTDNPRK